MSSDRLAFANQNPWIDHIYAKTALDLILDTITKNGHTTGNEARSLFLPFFARLFPLHVLTVSTCIFCDLFDNCTSFSGLDGVWAGVPTVSFGGGATMPARCTFFTSPPTPSSPLIPEATLLSSCHEVTGVTWLCHLQGGGIYRQRLRK